jgi:hypothetical protein
MLHWRCNNHRIQASTIQHLIEVGQTLDVRIQASHVLEACFADVAHRFKLTIWQPFKVANQIGSPVSAANYTDNDWFFHTAKIDRFELSKFLLTLIILIISRNLAFVASIRGQAAALGRFVIPGITTPLRYMVFASL